jgi:hypothetical protein
VIKSSHRVVGSAAMLDELPLYIFRDSNVVTSIRLAEHVKTRAVAELGRPGLEPGTNALKERKFT